MADNNSPHWTANVGNIISSVVGSNGIADEITALNTRSGYVVDARDVDARDPRAGVQSRNNTLFIILAIGAIVGLVFIIKK